MKIAIFGSMKHNFEDKKSNLIFHFTKSDTAISKILHSKRLKLNCIEKTNDPREFKSFRFGELGVATLKQEKISKEIKRNCKVISFCEDYFVENEWCDGFNLPRMWAQYGENHKGICLVIDKDLFIEENENMFENQFTFFKSINYTNEDDPRYIDYRKISKNGFSNYINEFIGLNYEYLFFQKIKDWETEHELKLVHFNAEETFCSIQKSLKKVITGIRFDRDKLPVLTRISKNIDIYPAYYEDGNIVL